jgi:hypothetical protein
MQAMGGHAMGAQPMGAADSSMVMPAKKSSVGLIFAIIAVLALVGGAVVLFVVMGKKTDDSGESSGEGEGEGEGEGTGTAAEGSGAGTGTGTGAGTGEGTGAGTGAGTGSQVAAVTPDAGVAAVTPDAAVVAATTPDAAPVVNTPPPDAAVAKVEPITVLVDSNADGAQIFENGKKIDKAPAMIKVIPGEPRTLVLKKKGYKDEEVTLDGGTPKVKVVLDKIEKDKPDGKGKGTGTSKGTGAGTGTKEDPRKKLCREHPDDPRCMLEP